MANVIDDGTLDTVIACDNCGKEFRFNFASTDIEDESLTETGDEAYERFKDDCIEEVETEHEEECKAESERELEVDKAEDARQYGE